MTSHKIVAGIDFGTTNSVASISDGHTSSLVPVEGTYNTIPTALFFDNVEHRVFMGRAAQQKYRDDFSDGRFMRSLKRILGTPAMRTGTQIGGRMVKYTDIITYFIKYLKERIEVAAQTSVTDVIMGRPVHFRDNDASGDSSAQSELEQIAYKSGFTNISFQYEPIAAAFSHEQKLSSEQLAVVIDIGGGTSDFSIIRLGPSRMNSTNRSSDILANTGVRIGGNDFDRDFSLGAFMPEFGLGTEWRSGDKILPVPNAPYIDLSTWSAVNMAYTPSVTNMMRGVQITAQSPEKFNRVMDILTNRLGHTNLDYIENAKIALSEHGDISVVMDFLSDAPEFNISVEKFNALISKNVSNIHASLTQCVKMSGVRNTDIDLIILTGGSTQIPFVASALQSLFPHANVSSDDKMGSVGLGLAYDAARKYLSV